MKRRYNHGDSYKTNNLVDYVDDNIDDYISRLPNETIHEIMSHIKNANILASWCTLDNRMYGLCRDKTFWINKFNNDLIYYPSIPTRPCDIIKMYSDLTFIQHLSSMIITAIQNNTDLLFNYSNKDNPIKISNIPTSIYNQFTTKTPDINLCSPYYISFRINKTSSNKSSINKSSGNDIIVKIISINQAMTESTTLNLADVIRLLTIVLYHSQNNAYKNNQPNDYGYISFEGRGNHSQRNFHFANLDDLYDFTTDLLDVERYID